MTTPATGSEEVYIEPGQETSMTREHKPPGKYSRAERPLKKVITSRAEVKKPVKIMVRNKKDRLDHKNTRAYNAIHFLANGAPANQKTPH
jgi:hypothetical protein